MNNDSWAQRDLRYKSDQGKYLGFILDLYKDSRLQRNKMIQPPPPPTLCIIHHLFTRRGQ